MEKRAFFMAKPKTTAKGTTPIKMGMTERMPRKNSFWFLKAIEHLSSEEPCILRICAVRKRLYNGLERHGAYLYRNSGVLQVRKIG
jgi:hypothetical protein